MDNSIFASMPPTRLFLRCAVPSMISMAVTSLYTIADGIFVGKFIGAGALAAINLVMPFIMISFALADMIAVGSSVQISIKLGEKKKEEASQIFSFASGLILFVSVIVGGIGLFAAEPLVRLMGADREVTVFAVEYMRVYAVFSPAIMIFFAVDNYLRICGKVYYSMVMNVVISLLNIVLDWFFIVYLKKGVASAALASCISLMVGTFAGYLPFFRKKMPLKLCRAKLKLSSVMNLFANGSSMFFSNISGSVLMAVVNTVLLHLSGSTAVAAFSIVMYVDSIMNSLITGMTDSIQPAISYNYGAKNRTRIFAFEKRLVLTASFISGFFMIAMFAGAEHIVPFFMDKYDLPLFEMSTRAMRIFSLSYLFAWFNIIAGSFFTALNRPKKAVALSFCQTFFFPLANLMVLPLFMELDGVWAMPLAADFMSAVLAGIFMMTIVKQFKKDF